MIIQLIILRDLFRRRAGLYQYSGAFAEDRGGRRDFRGVNGVFRDSSADFGPMESTAGDRRRRRLPFASFVNQHHFAAFMEMTIGLTLALLFRKATGKDKRLLLIIASILMGMAILFTGSRGGLLSLLGVLGFILLMNFLRREEGDEKRFNSRETH